jgi:hypothetical protein
MAIDSVKSNTLKAGVVFIGSIALLIASISVALAARHYQISGQPMPNGKGGAMTFTGGYLVAVVLFLISAAWFLGARRLLLTRKT